MVVFSIFSSHKNGDIVAYWFFHFIIVHFVYFYSFFSLLWFFSPLLIRKVYFFSFLIISCLVLSSLVLSCLVIQHYLYLCYLSCSTIFSGFYLVFLLSSSNSSFYFLNLPFIFPLFLFLFFFLTTRCCFNWDRKSVV